MHATQEAEKRCKAWSTEQENGNEAFFRVLCLLFRFGGLNELLGEPKEMVDFMSTLQSAFDEVTNDNFQYKVFRRAILDCHGYIKAMFEEV